MWIFCFGRGAGRDEPTSIGMTRGDRDDAGDALVDGGGDRAFALNGSSCGFSQTGFATEEEWNAALIWSGVKIRIVGVSFESDSLLVLFVR